jgi:hypothetical protein
VTTDSRSAAARISKRYRKASLVWFHVLDGGPGTEGTEGIGAGFDISRSGLGISTPREIPLGARVLVHLRCREFEVTALCRVVRVRVSPTGQYEIGMEIVMLPPDHRALINRVFP